MSGFDYSMYTFRRKCHRHSNAQKKKQMQQQQSPYIHSISNFAEENQTFRVLFTYLKKK